MVGGGKDGGKDGGKWMQPVSISLQNILIHAARM